MVKSMKKMKLYTILALVSILLIGTILNTKTYGSNESISLPMSSDTTIPTTEFVDYGNGTTSTKIDYQNGTFDEIRETMILTSQSYTVLSDTQTLNLTGEVPTSTEECTDWITTETEMIFDHYFRFGFYYGLADIRYTFFELGVKPIAWLKLGAEVDIGFGLRLPVAVRLEYPEQMTIQKDYTCYATIFPLDLPSHDELKISFQAYAYIDVGIIGLGGQFNIGPTEEWTESFYTPIGSGMAFPVNDLNIKIWDILALSMDLYIEPKLGSDKVTARASCFGDGIVTGNDLITWTEPYQRKEFTVHADDYNILDNFAHIMLSDYRYYFSRFDVDFGLKVNLNQLINDWFLIGDPKWKFLTINMGFLTDGLYIGILSGDPFVAIVNVFVKRYAPLQFIFFPTQFAIPGNWAIYNILVVNWGNIADEFILSLAGLDPPFDWEYEFSQTSVTLVPLGSQWVQLKIMPYRHFSTTPSAYAFNVIATSQGADAEGLTILHDVPITVIVLPFYEVNAIITPVTNSVIPGEIVEYSISIRNLGNVEDTFAITTSGIDSNWLWELSSESVTLDPGDETTVQLSIIPYRHYSTAPGDYPFDVIVSNPRTSDTETAIVHILPFYDVDLIITPVYDSTFPSGSVTYQLDVRNFGNVIDGVLLDFDFIDFNGDYRVYPTIIQESWVSMPLVISEIAPGAIGTEYLTIAAPFDWAGMEDATYEFITTVNSFGDSLVTDNENAYILSLIHI